MFRNLIAWISLVSVEASRVQTHELSHSKFGASCETLENRFHTRVVSFRTSLDAMDQEAGVSTITQVRTALRLNGIIRVMRRARECPWVVENNSDDLDDLRGIVQELLADNPCANAARAEMQTGISAETEEVQAGTLPRVLSILMSDDCVAELVEANPAEPLEVSDAHLRQDEEEVQDGLEDLLADAENSESAFLQTDQSTVLRFFRVVGVIFLTLILIMGCVGASALILGFLAGAVGFVGYRLGLIGYRHGLIDIVETGLHFGFLGGLASMLPCILQMVTQLTVPQLDVSPAATQ